MRRGERRSVRKRGPDSTLGLLLRPVGRRGEADGSKPLAVAARGQDNLVRCGLGVLPHKEA